MVDNIKILEDLVVEAVDRLRELKDERQQLGKEVGSLEERLDALKREASQGEDGPGGKSVVQDRRELALATVRAALTDLRGDGSQ